MKEISLNEILLAREMRAERQQKLLKTYHGTLLCFTMNIAGPVKYSPLIELGFRIGKERLRGALLREKIRILYDESMSADTGCEAYFVLDKDAADIKKIAVAIEEEDELGRLFDMDVIDRNGCKIDRDVKRTCLMCGNEAKACARSRTHSVTELQAKTNEILNKAASEYIAAKASSIACRALLYEVCTTLKPGLVDRVHNGSHDDMNVFTFSASCAALYPYFAHCAQIGFETRDDEPQDCFPVLRQAGLRAEEQMLLATQGVNTHKGAIFSLGILCAAMGRLPLQWSDSERLLDECAQIAGSAVHDDLIGISEQKATTAGQKIYLQYGITGARGQAAAGFPLVKNVGLPTLENTLKNGYSENDAGCLALLHIMAENKDTNLIHRGGKDGMALVMRLAKEALSSDNPLSHLESMDQAMTKLRLSPGGSADLLSMCWMLHFAGEVR